MWRSELKTRQVAVGGNLSIELSIGQYFYTIDKLQSTLLKTIAKVKRN